MKAKLAIDIGYSNQHHAGFYLPIEIDFAPNLQIEFEHPVWHNPRKPVAISYSVPDESFYIVLERVVTNNEQEARQMADIYRSHEWKEYGVDRD